MTMPGPGYDLWLTAPYDRQSDFDDLMSDDEADCEGCEVDEDGERIVDQYCRVHGDPETIIEGMKEDYLLDQAERRAEEARDYDDY